MHNKERVNFQSFFPAVILKDFLRAVERLKDVGGIEVSGRGLHDEKAAVEVNWLGDSDDRDIVFNVKVILCAYIVKNTIRCSNGTYFCLKEFKWGIHFIPSDLQNIILSFNWVPSWCVNGIVPQLCCWYHW